MAKQNKKNVFSGRILEIEGLGHLKCEQAFELSDASAERSAAGCAIAMNPEPIAEYLKSNIVMLQWMVAEGYGDARTIERRVAAMEAWLANPELLKADKGASYVHGHVISLMSHVTPVAAEVSVASLSSLSLSLSHTHTHTHVRTRRYLHHYLGSFAGTRRRSTSIWRTSRSPSCAAPTTPTTPASSPPSPVTRLTRYNIRIAQLHQSHVAFSLSVRERDFFCSKSASLRWLRSSIFLVLDEVRALPPFSHTRTKTSLLKNRSSSAAA